MARSFSQRDGLYAVVDCSGWDDFRIVMRQVLETTCATQKISDRVVFRGQSCSSWKLVSSFDRAYDKFSAADRDRKYKELIVLFRENYEVYGGLSRGENPEFLEDIQNLPSERVEAIAQHYGLGTRLLDWSFSPYVAAFFSLSRINECKSGKLSIWSLDKAIFEKFSPSELTFSRDLYRRNVRNLWQMGAFTRNLTSTPDMLDLFRKKSMAYDHVLDAGHPPLIRFDIPLGSEDQIQDDLQLMRINSMTIFPGLEGVVSWLKARKP